jgi:hypothetical protein
MKNKCGVQNKDTHNTIPAGMAKPMRSRRTIISVDGVSYLQQLLGQSGAIESSGPLSLLTVQVAHNNSRSTYDDYSSIPETKMTIRTQTSPYQVCTR